MLELLIEKTQSGMIRALVIDVDEEGYRSVQEILESDQESVATLKRLIKAVYPSLSDKRGWFERKLKAA